MRRAPQMSAASYVRKIERRLGECCGRALVLSPRDWALASDWHARGIPLGLVEEAIAAAIERAGRRGRTPRGSLSALAPAVHEAWQAVVDGRVAPPRSHAPAGSAGSALAEWKHRLGAEREDSALARLLSELLARLDAGAEPTIIDAELDQRLGDTVDRELAERVERTLERDLAPHRGRIGAERLARSARRARLERLREALGLPRLASGPSPG